MINSEINLLGNHVYTRALDLNIKQQKQNAYVMETFIKKNFIPLDKNEDLTPTNKSLISKAWSFNNFYNYNYLLYPLKGMPNLYNKIKETFYMCLQESKYEEYSIQCWLNVYRKGNFIDWHAHWPEKWEAWHGFYCVDVEPDSHTMYRLKDKRIPEDDIKVESKNNLLVLSKSGYDIHKSSEWDQDYPRITVAFDIIPTYNLHITKKTFELKNHWIPI